MNPKEYDSILTFAINAEVEAQNFYADLAEQVSDNHLKAMFLEFVDEEKRHEKILKGFRSQGTGHLHFKGAPDFKVSETIEKPTSYKEMKPADAIALAMKNEEEAMRQYSHLAQVCIDPEQKRVLQELAAMEREHKHKMEKAFVDIGYPEVW